MSLYTHTSRMVTGINDQESQDDIEDSPQTVRDVLSHDYKIPGISRRYYIPLALFITVVIVLFVWEFWWYTWDNVFLGAVLLLLGLSALAVAVQRIVRHLKQ